MTRAARDAAAVSAALGEFGKLAGLNPSAMYTLGRLTAELWQRAAAEAKRTPDAVVEALSALVAQLHERAGEMPRATWEGLVPYLRAALRALADARADDSMQSMQSMQGVGRGGGG